MSSDYGDDDEDFLLNLDDDDLRILEEVEEKCGVQVSQMNSVAHYGTTTTIMSTRGANPPPPKRAKVGGRTPVQDAQMSDDDAPDILVNADGTYSLDSPEPSLVSIRAHSLAFSGSSKYLVPEPTQQRPVPPTHGPARNGGASAARSLQRHNSSNSIHDLDTPPSTQGARPLVRAGSLSQAISRGLAKNGAPPTQYPLRTGNDVIARPRDEHLQRELDALRAQLAQAESERQKLRTFLEESKEHSFAKSGEAENLRRTMRKQTEQHAEEVARLRQEMVDAENAKLEAERRTKLEMDQLRTAMAFKQYERETSRRGFPNVNASLRKRQTPGSAQTQSSTPAISRMMDLEHSPLSPRKKVPRGLMPPPPVPGERVSSSKPLRTPVSLAAQFALSNSFCKKEKSFSNLTNSFARSTSPVKQLRNRPMKFNESTSDDKDSFAPMVTSTQQPPKDKGKGKAKPEDSWLDENTSTPAQRLTFGTQGFWDRPRPATQAPFAIELDIFGSNTAPQTPAKIVEAHPRADIIEQVHYADELRMVLLTHIALFRPPEGQKTFSLQHLLTVPVTLDLQKRFSTACTGLFDAFSASSGLADGGLPAWDQCASKASLALAQLAQVFGETEHVDSLYILFNLLITVCTAVPGIAGYLLNAGAQEGDSLLASTLCNVILRCTKDNLGQSALWYLGESTLTLCETLGWQATDDGIIRQARLAKTNPPTTNDSVKVPLVELLCRHLSGYRKHDTKDHLAIADTQALTTLVESLTLIPSLVSFIYHVTSAIWSELELSENSAESHDSCPIDALRLAIQLLHYLSFSSDPEPNIRERLCYAPRGSFNGLVHMFIVAFGRLSSGDPPEYLDETRSAMIREIRGMSEALLGIVVDGPEVEGIYDVFHDSEDDERGVSGEEKVDASVTDEEEALQMSVDGF
ncbi:hypothetical protein FRC10_002206 [Ceratobasidium sp. 414]|nr:hypothetical protein FRC10_002206 [Ceratobasidium sp. 414]